MKLNMIFNKSWLKFIKNIKNGKKFLQIPKEFEKDFENIQNRYYVEDTDVGFIEDFLADKKETCLEQLWREALGHTNPRDKATRIDKERITNILVNMKNWKLYDGNPQHKKRISGKKKGFDGYMENVSYGVQKAWIWFENEEDLEKRKKEVENQKQQEAADVINKVLGQNKEYEDYFGKIGE